MALPNRFGRRNVGNVSRNVMNRTPNPRPGTGNMMNAQMSRAQALRVMGIGAAGVAAAGLGFGGAVRAAQIAPPGSDPLGLLDGAETTVPALFNPTLGEIKSAVTAVKFHSNVEIGTNVDGSKRYVPSYDTNGLVDEPVYVDKEMNGVKYKQYSGELSGDGWLVRPGTTVASKYFYGPIDESGVDHTNDPSTPPTHPRRGLKGVNFVLYIPENWNGVLIHSMTGGFQTFAGYVHTGFDEFLLLSRGFAYVVFDTSGQNSPTDTNVNNDEYWLENVKLMVNPLNQKSTTSPQTFLNPQVSINRDAIRVMKNIIKNHYNSEGNVVTYLLVRSASGPLATSLTTGIAVGGILNGGNYETPYINSPLHPANLNDPNKTFTEPMIYDGFINFSGGVTPSVTPVSSLRPNIPISNAIYIYYDSSNDSYISGVSFAYLAHQAKYANGGAYSAYWPDIKSTIFNYTFENHPHFDRAWVYAAAKNGSGIYVVVNDIGTFPLPGTSPLSFNQDGIGKEVTWHVARKVRVAEANGLDYHTKIYVSTNQAAAFTVMLYLHEHSIRLEGVSHQLLTDLDECVRDGTPMPTSIIDPYWIDGNKIWPKQYHLGTNPISFPPIPGGTAFGLFEQSDLHLGLGNSIPNAPRSVDISDPVIAGGVYFAAIKYVRDYVGTDPPMIYESKVVRVPDDAARLGLYFSISGGLVQTMYRAFTEDELVNGFPAKDWNNQPLVTMTTQGGKRRIPLDGYVNHGRYVSAMSQAVNALVRARLHDAEIGGLFVQQAAQSEYPVTEHKNLGEVMRNYPEQDPASLGYIWNEDTQQWELPGQ